MFIFRPPTTIHLRRRSPVKWMMIPLPPTPQIISSLSVCLPPGAILLTNYKLWQVDSVGVEIVTGETANTEAANLKSLKPQPFVNVMWIMCVRNFKNLLLMNIKTW